MILNRKSETPLYLQIYDAFKHQILNGTLLANDTIPSIRALCKKHNISKTTVEKAYQQLLIEGYIEAYPKSGYLVKPITPLNPLSKEKPKAIEESPYINLNQSLDLFDLTSLRKLYNACFIDYQAELIKPASASGEYPLKEAITKLLVKERGCELVASQLIISSGLQNQLVILSSLLKQKRIAYLVPLFNRAKQTLNDLGFTLIPCHSIDEILQAKPDFIYISPSNLYPSGDVLPITKRMRLIDYAQKHHAYIIEDDYNHLFRYNAAIIPSIQGLAKGQHVIYINSFSRSYLVSMRLSYMILPNDLLKTYHQQTPYSQTVSKIDQLAMASFIQLGHHQKHLKKLSLYAKRQNDMISSVLNQIKLPHVKTIYGLKSNLHILFELESSTALNHVIKQAKLHDIYVETFDELPLTVLLPYNHVDKTTFESMLKHLF